jgi:hypothetical protein
MMNGMGSMMAFGWVGGLLVAALVVAGIVWLAREPGRSGGQIVLVVLAAIGGIALVGVAAMFLMHGGMSCCT